MEMSDEERKRVMETMSDNFDFQDEPKVGIFWYDTESGSLFGVSKIEACDLAFNSNGFKTVRTLYKTWWMKQRMRARSKQDYHSIFEKDYIEIPRGRIFQREDGTFQLMCGSWITDHIVNMVKEEFDLDNVTFEYVIDTHWELGHGWSEE